MAGHAYVELVGGPSDGQLLDMTRMTAEDLVDGMLLIRHGLVRPEGPLH